MNLSNQSNNPRPSLQVPQQISVGQNETVSYYVYLPSDYSASEKFSLLLFLHGRGECGNSPEELPLVLEHGPPKLIAQGNEFPFIVISPQQAQTTDDQWWIMERLLRFIDAIEKEFSIDPHRRYCTGLSMGGFACWELGVLLPNYFAALAPVCGGGKTEWAAKLSSTPIWAFHGVQDDVIPVQRSEEIVAAIQKTTGNVCLTLYPEAEHDSWTQTYDNPELYQWLLSQQLT